MPMTRFLLVTLLAGALLQACTTSSGGGNPAPLCQQPAGCPNPDPATTQLMSPTVSFATDVVPIFQASCSLSSSCHQAKMGGPSGVYLGPAPGMPADPAGVFATIVNKPSVELSSMSFVKPGDLANSYLMHKMDGDMCQFISQCGPLPASQCGVVMPQSSCVLDGATRDKVRRWIAQGAQNN
jgi:hypothetical protein